jgi:Protein of unknown function (DUF3131)
MTSLTLRSRRPWSAILTVCILLSALVVHQLLLWQETKVLPTPVAHSIPLSGEDRQLARNAWRYFEANRLPTGLVSSAEKFPATTMWDVGSQLAGMTAARELKLLPAEEFDRWMSQTLDSLAKLPLYQKELPNKAYNAATLVPVNYGKLDRYQEIGFSALDLGRLARWLDIVAARYPQHAAAVKAITAQWTLTRLTANGQLMGTTVKDSKENWNQEGRLGYEQYGAYGLTKLSIQAKAALDPKAEMTTVKVMGVDVPVDKRTTYHNYVTSEPYILDGLESGFKALPVEYAGRVLQAQQQRFLDTHQLTTWSEDNLDKAPWFVYNTVYVNGTPWKSIDASGKDASEFRGSSTKAAVGWHMLFRTRYTAKAYKGLRWLADPAKGVFAGYYEATQQPNRALTLNTNGIILESLLYNQAGKPLEVWAHEAH